MGMNDLISRKALYKAWDKLDETQDPQLLIDEMIRATQDLPAVDAQPITGDTSDGYHTFNELYHHRAVLFSVIVNASPDRAWKSLKHHDGSMYDGMFIVGIESPDGQATYHYDKEPYWDMFACRELERAPEWDGHTPAQAIERIGRLKLMQNGRWDDLREAYNDVPSPKCNICGRVIYGLESNYNYCPNCGARMEAKRSESET